MPNSSADLEPVTLIGWTTLTTNGRPLVPPKLNRRRALFVLAKIDEILAWEQNTELERETRFVELGRYLCEVRAGQYWRLGNLHSFDEVLEGGVPPAPRESPSLIGLPHPPPRGAQTRHKRVGGGHRG